MIFATVPFFEYFKLYAKRRATLRSDGSDPFLFQPHFNYRTLQFDKALSTRMAQNIVKRWASYGGLEISHRMIFRNE